ncbi:hypothetical protein [Bartonella sp. B30(2025)]
MNIKYFFIIFTVIFGFFSVVNASECTDIKGSAPIIINPTDFSKALLYNTHDEILLNKVVSSSHSSLTVTYSAPWKAVGSGFSKMKQVYCGLAVYFYNFFLSMFKL